MAQIACMHRLVIFMDSLTFPHSPRAVDAFSSNELCWIELMVPPKLAGIELDCVLAGTGGIVGKVGGLEGLIVEGARGSLGSRCVGISIQRDKSLELVLPPD